MFDFCRLSYTYRVAGLGVLLLAVLPLFWCGTAVSATMQSFDIFSMVAYSD